MAQAGRRGGGSRSDGGRRGAARRPRRRARRAAPGEFSGALDGRVRLLRVVFIVAFVAIGGKAVALASTEGNLAKIARSQQLRTVVLPAHRGSILDRGGQELAVDQAAKTVYATPYMLDDPRSAAHALAKALKIKRWRPIYRAIDDPKSGFAFVERQADPTLADRATGLGLPGVSSYPEEKRVYPMRTVAAQVVGYAGIDNRGLAGMEFRYDNELAGKPGRQVVVQDPAGRALNTVQSTQPTSGEDVRLTVDNGIQLMADRVLADTVRLYHAKGGTAIVEDPKTGEIYAMSNVPLVNANHFGKSPKDQGNKAVIYSYEPGSTFKAITVGAALSEGVVTPRTRFTVPGAFQVGDRVIHDSHPHGTETLTVREILAQSSNIGAVKIGQRLGKDLLLQWISAFGFGRPTGIDFPGEVSGFVLPGDKWWSSTIGNVPMGQGISVTPIQMVAAYGAIANDGLMMRPYLTAQVGTRVHRPQAMRRVVSPQVARELRSMLSDVVADGTGTEAQIPGYVVAGKTGTAQKALTNGLGYSKYNYVASFIGMVPADDPQLIVAVVVDEPHPYWGGVVAAPAFRQIASYALQRLEIAP